MATSSTTGQQYGQLDGSFADRLEASLGRADAERQRHLLWRRAQRWLPLILLVGPVVGWRLIIATPDAFHLGVAMLAWITFLLDVGVHLDAAFLRYLGLQGLPSLVGGVLLLVLTAQLLGFARE